jgi:uncharacterized membrane protein
MEDHTSLSETVFVVLLIIVVAFILCVISHFIVKYW